MLQSSNKWYFCHFVMFFMMVLLLSKLFIINIGKSWVIKLHGNYVFLLVVLLVVGVIEH